VKAVQTGRMVWSHARESARPIHAAARVSRFRDGQPRHPALAECRPWQQIPVQFSAHVEERGGGWLHHQWIADGPEDPRPALAEAVVAACAGARRVVAYHASFERECIKRLRRARRIWSRSSNGSRNAW